PFQHPEFTLGLLRRLSVAHGQVEGFAGIVQMNDELGRAISLAGFRIDRRHSKPDGIASLESVVESTVQRLARTEKVRKVAVQNQSSSGALRSGRCSRKNRNQYEGCRQYNNSSRIFHGVKRNPTSLPSSRIR